MRPLLAETRIGIIRRMRQDKLKFGVHGTARVPCPEAERGSPMIGVAIADDGFITVTGACPGLPLESAGCLRVRRPRGGDLSGSQRVGTSTGTVRRWNITTSSFIREAVSWGERSSHPELRHRRHRRGSVRHTGRVLHSYDEGKLSACFWNRRHHIQIRHIVKKIKKNTGARIFYDAARSPCQRAARY